MSLILSCHPEVLFLESAGAKAFTSMSVLNVIKTAFLFFSSRMSARKNYSNDRIRGPIALSKVTRNFLKSAYPFRT